MFASIVPANPPEVAPPVRYYVIYMDEALVWHSIEYASLARANEVMTLQRRRMGRNAFVEAR